MHPVWLLVAVIGVGVVTGTASQCLEPPRCLEVDSESSVMECFQFYRATNFPTGRLQPTPPLLLPSSSSPDAKSSYSMEHFRWGKPVGRKRRPIRIYTSDGKVEEGEESPEALTGEMGRRAAAAESDVTQEEEEEEEEGEETEEQLHKKKEGTYRVKSARWSPLLAGKRYGGFMKSGDERSQRPLLTLFKNVINKDGQEEEEEEEEEREQ